MFNEREGLHTKAEVEAVLPVYFKKIHATVTAILKEHASEDFKKEEEEIEKNKIQMIIKVLSTIQTTLITQESKRKHDMGTMIGSVKEDIRNTMGNNVANEVIDSTFKQLIELSESLKSYFDQMFGKMEQIDENVVAIR